MKALFAVVLPILFGQVQDATKADPTVPANAPVLLSAVGSGVQIYVCAAPGGVAQWTLQGPQATLTDGVSQKAMGMHTAGPTWTWKDGSSTHGAVVAKQASPDAGSVPWLLLAAQPTPAHGVLASVVWIRRSDTSGGVAPSEGCDAGHVGGTVRVPYRATYTFFGGAK